MAGSAGCSAFDHGDALAIGSATGYPGYEVGETTPIAGTVAGYPGYDHEDVTPTAGITGYPEYGRIENATSGAMQSPSRSVSGALLESTAGMV